MPRAGQLSAAARGLRESIFSRLAGRLAGHGSDGVPLHLGDTYLAPPPLALDTQDPSLWRYGAPAGERALLERLAAKLQRANGLTGMAPENLQITVGATQALSAAARAVADPGDEVIVPTPHWPLIRGILITGGAVPVEVPLTQQLYAQPDADPAALLAPAITPRTAALYLTTPNNPDGKVLSRAQLERLADLACRHDLWVLSDEVYEDLAYGAPHVSIASLPGMAERTISVFSLSKSWALAGYRLGYAVGPRQLMHALRKIANHTVYNVPDVLQRAAGALLDDAQAAEWRSRARSTYVEARDLAMRLCPAPCFVPEGATYLLVDLSKYVGDAPDAIWPLVERLLDAGVSISPGEQLGRGFERHARLCFTAVPPDRLVVGLERFAATLAATR
jgi:aspartate/methionine/tyrosine aminotransferase